jgi:hypothetical protein
MTELLRPADLPDGFAYPPEFVRVVELGLVNPEPWWIFGGEPLRQRLRGLAKRYPERTLIPFAKREDNDDIACWEGKLPRVVVVHDYASSGWAERAEYPDFNAWFRQAIEDCLDFA